MSTTIDDRIVMMKFDNKDFERNAKTSMSTLDLLKEKLDFSKVQSGLETIDTSKLRTEFEKIGDIDTGKLDSVLDRMEYRMSNMGIFVSRIVENVADSIYAIVQKALSGITSVVNFAESGIIQGGYSRASNIQSAKFQLEGLGIAWKDIADDIDYAVKNTAYSLDQAAIVSSRLASSGLKPGQQYITSAGVATDIDTMAMVLRGISGTAAATGGKADYGDIGNIFTKMISYGKVNLQQLNELGTYGIGATGILAEYFSKIGYEGRTNWTEGDIREITGSRDKILDPMVVIEAMYEKFGEHAVKANETLSGVMANTKAALARIGENFFTPIIENGGPLVHLFEALRQSINDLNGAIGPVIKLFGGDVAKVLDKIAGKFLVKENVLDEDGNITYDLNGNPVYTYHLKEKGGIFSSWFQPWSNGQEWHQFDDSILSNISEGGERGYWADITETRAERVAKNIRAILNNTGTALYNFASNVTKAFQQVFPNYQGFSDLLVRITNKLAYVTEKWKLSEFLNPPTTWRHSGIYSILRGMFAGIDIIYRFGKSFKEHILDPIFNKGKTLVANSPVGDWLVDISNKIWDFDLMLKGQEDYFGPFIERVKNKIIEIKDIVVNFVQDAGPKIQKFFTDIANWWAPVKDIIFDGDLDLKEKLQAIKDYFSENFEIPGWEKVKNVFGSIKDSISFIVDKIKEFFGIGNEEERNITHQGLAAVGVGKMGKTDIGVSVLDFIEKSNEETKKMPSIADRIADFFSKIKDTFSGFEFNSAKALVNTFAIVLILLIAAISYAVYKIPKLFGKFTSSIPELVQGFLKGFNDLLFGISTTLRAQRWESYSGILKNIALAVGILAATFAILAGVVFLMNKYGDGVNIMDSMEKAGAVLTKLIISMSGVLSLLILLTRNSTSLMVGWNPSSGFGLSLPFNALATLKSTLQVFVFSILELSALIVILGLIPQNVIDQGYDNLTSISNTLLKIVIGMSLLNALLSSIMAKINVKIFATTLASISSMFVSFAISISSLTMSLIILGLIPQDIFDKGYNNFITLGTAFAIITGILLIIAAAASSISKLKSTNIAAVMFGIATIIFAMSNAILIIGIAMTIISKVVNDTGTWIKTLISLVAISGLLIAVPAILMSVIDSFNSGGYASIISSKEIYALALTIVSFGAAILMMSKGLSIIGTLSYGKMWSSFGVIFLLFGEFTTIVGLLHNINSSDLYKVGYTMLAMTGAMTITATALSILTSFADWTEIAAAGITLIAAIGVMGAIVFGISKLPVDTTKMESVLKFTGSIALLSLSLIPFVGAMVILMNALNKITMDPADMWHIFGILAAAMGSLGLITIILGGMANTTGPASLDQVLALIGLSLSLIPMAGAISMILLAVSTANIDATSASLIIGALAIAILAMGAAIGLMSKGLGTISTATAGKVVGMVVVMVGAIVAIGLSIATMVYAVGKWNVDIGRLISAGAIVLVLTGWLTLVTKWLSNIAMSMSGIDFANFESVIFGFAAVCVSMVALGLAVAVLGTLDYGTMWSSFAVIALLGFGVTAIVKLLQVISRSPGQVANLVPTIIGYATVSASLSLLAVALVSMKDVSEEKLLKKATILSALGIAIDAIVWLLIKIAGGNPFDSLAAIAGFIVVSSGMIALAYTLNKIKDLDMEKVRDQILLLGGSLLVMAAVATLLSTVTSGLGALGMGAFGAMCLGIAAALAAAGFLFSVAEPGINAFLTLFENLQQNPNLFIDGMKTMSSSLVEGFVAGLATFSAKLPEILIYIESILSTIEGFILTRFGKYWQFLTSFLKLLLSGIASLVEDPEIKGSLKTIIDNILDFAEDNAEEWARKAAQIGIKISTGFIEGLLGIDTLEGTFEKVATPVLTFFEKALNGDLIGAMAYSWAYLENGLVTTLSNSSKKEEASSERHDWRSSENANERAAMQAAGIDPNTGNKISTTKTNNMLTQMLSDQISGIKDSIANGPIATEISETRDEFFSSWDRSWSEPRETSTKSTNQNNVLEEDTLAKIVDVKTSAQTGNINTQMDDTVSTVETEYSNKYYATGSTPHGPMGTAPNGASILGQIIANDLSGLATDAREGGIALTMTTLVSLIHNKFNDSMADTSDIVSPSNPFMSDLMSDLSSTLISATSGEISMNIMALVNLISSKIDSEFDGLTGKSSIGENIVGGIMSGMLDWNSRQKIVLAASGVSNMVIDEIKRAFKIHSPAREPRLVNNSEMITAGMAYSMIDDKSKGYLKNSTDEIADTTVNNLSDSTESAMEDADFMGVINSYLDIGAIKSTIESNWKNKVPSLSALIPDLSFSKSLSENGDALSEAWSNIKGIFLDDDGNFDLSWLLEGVNVDLEGLVNGFMKDLGFDQESLNTMISETTAGMNLEGIDISEMGFGITADSIDTSEYDKWINDFGGFNAADYDNGGELNFKINLDTSEYESFIKDATTQNLAAKIGMPEGYRKSTTGSNTYVNNYTYNQSNTSTSPLSTRDINRQTQLTLMRNKWRNKG